MTHPRVNLSLVLVLLVLSGGCSKHRHDHHEHAGGHAHTAPHGGTLIELGDHEFNLEFLHDRTEGTLTAFVLDGHADQSIRIAQMTIELLIDRDGRTLALSLDAVGNPLSNETPGNTSEFVAAVEWLNDATMISGRIREITVRGTTYREVPFVLW